MQTFFLDLDISNSAYYLWENGRGSNRLNNQINEALIILRTLTGWYIARGRKGWPHHQCTKMWAGYEPFLAAYIDVHIQVYASLSGNDCSKRYGDLDELVDMMTCSWNDYLLLDFDHLPWLTEEFVNDHRKLIFAKVANDEALKEWYGQFEWGYDYANVS